jgi:Phosphate-starvation-inducible E family
MDSTNFEEKLRSNSSQALYLLETVFYIAAGILLSAAACVAVFEAGAILWRSIISRSFADYGLLMLDRLLLVLMLVEILHTVRISILSKEFMLVKPFLIIGLIASIRRVLVITMHAAKLAEEGLGTDQGAIAFRNSMIELGLLGFMVLVFAVSMYFLNHTSPREGLQ